MTDSIKQLNHKIQIVINRIESRPFNIPLRYLVADQNELNSLKAQLAKLEK